MGFGEAAKAAFAKAVEALQAIAEVKAMVQQIQHSSTAYEQRIESRFIALETRIRELERENAKLNGQVQSAYGDALKTLLLESQRRDRPRDLPQPQVEQVFGDDHVHQRHKIGEPGT